jgi:hypothetical protein
MLASRPSYRVIAASLLVLYVALRDPLIAAVLAVSFLVLGIAWAITHVPDERRSGHMH